MMPIYLTQYLAPGKWFEPFCSNSDMLCSTGRCVLLVSHFSGPKRSFSWCWECWRLTACWRELPGSRSHPFLLTIPSIIMEVSIPFAQSRMLLKGLSTPKAPCGVHRGLCWDRVIIHLPCLAHFAPSQVNRCGPLEQASHLPASIPESQRLLAWEPACLYINPSCWKCKQCFSKAKMNSPVGWVEQKYWNRLEKRWQIWSLSLSTDATPEEFTFDLPICSSK